MTMTDEPFHNFGASNSLSQRFLNYYIRFPDFLILRHENCEKVRRVSPRQTKKTFPHFFSSLILSSISFET